MTDSASTLSSVRIAGHLPPELERDRHELLGGGLGDLAADRRAARVEQVIPAHAGEGTGELETADDDIDAVAVERRVDHLAQAALPQAGVYSEGLITTRLPAASISTSGPTDEVEREVPGDDVADHALGLRLDEGAARAVQRRVGVLEARCAIQVASCSAA